MEAYLADFSTNATLTKKKKISESRTVTWYVIASLCPTVFELRMKEKKEERKRNDLTKSKY